jgi:two-component system OmpR family sensor kinase
VKSIRAKLVLWMVAALCCGMGAVLVVTYWSVRNEIGRIFDAELAAIAHAVHLREDWVRAGRLRIARPGFFFAVRAYDADGRVYFETRLPELPADAPQAYEQGYRYVDTTDGRWRLYTHVTLEGNVQVGQPLAIRDALARDLSMRALAPVLLLVPMLGFLVSWALNRGLVPLRQVSQRVGSRDARRLDPLPTADVPAELLPLIDQINLLLARLASSLDSQRTFLADAAHELRSPVTALALQAQIAERAVGEGQRSAAFGELKLGIERASRLVNQLLDFAHLEPGVSPEPTGTVDVSEVVREVVGSYAAQAERKGVDLGADAPGDAVVEGGEDELRSLIGNLVDNGLRYAPPGSSVTVVARRVDSTVRLVVTDCGPGIPADERRRVFQRFHRVPGDRSPGNGLGLPIVKAIVERHHGSIALGDANPGRHPPGLEVRVELPASAAG